MNKKQRRTKASDAIKIDKQKELPKLGKRMKQIRAAKGYRSYEAFAFDKGINRSQYGRYERGQEDLCYISLLKVLKGYGISLREFFSEGFNKKRDDTETKEDEIPAPPAAPSPKAKRSKPSSRRKPSPVKKTSSRKKSSSRSKSSPRRKLRITVDLD